MTFLSLQLNTLIDGIFFLENSPDEKKNKYPLKGPSPLLIPLTLSPLLIKLSPSQNFFFFFLLKR